MLTANVFYVRPKTDLEDGNHTWHHDRKYMVREVKNGYTFIRKKAEV